MTKSRDDHETDKILHEQRVRYQRTLKGKGRRRGNEGRIMFNESVM